MSVSSTRRPPRRRTPLDHNFHGDAGGFTPHEAGPINPNEGGERPRLRVYSQSIELNGRHEAILMTIRERGATVDEFSHHLLAREFDELRDNGLIIYWRDGEPRPYGTFGLGTRTNAWYLTSDGAEAAGLELPPLRFA
jgi:hypothetical protein